MEIIRRFDIKLYYFVLLTLAVHMSHARYTTNTNTDVPTQTANII